MPAGRTIAVHDLQIAVTAHVIGYQIATRDVRSLPRISGLEFEQW
jgi:predicted nucleic acid-binding protein